MTNSVVLVGRITQDLTIQETENSKRTFLILAVPREFKNSDGNYETDFIKCTLWNGVATNTKEYCKKGDVIGIKGRLQSSQFEKDGETVYTMEVIADKVTFLTSKHTSAEKAE